MRKFLLVLAVVGLCGGLYYLYSRYEIRQDQGAIIIQPKDPARSAYAPQKKTAPFPTDPLNRPAVRKDREWVRIASFNPGNLSPERLRNPIVLANMAEVLQDFDVIALQDVREKGTVALAGLVQEMNATGRHYEFAVSPETSVGQSDWYNAFLFDTASVEIDHDKIYTINDPDKRLPCKPLVGQFRVRGPNPLQAFTFVLINVRVTSERHARAEVDLLADVLSTTKKILPAEDDFLLAGCLETDPENFGKLGQIRHLTPTITNQITTSAKAELRDNLLVDRMATIEYLGKSNVVDLTRRLNLSLLDTQMIASHLPVWADFSLYEGEGISQSMIKTSP